MNLKERQENYKFFYDTIKRLSHSQKFYGMCLRNLEELTEYQKAKLIKQLPKFNNSTDVILWLEE